MTLRSLTTTTRPRRWGALLLVALFFLVGTVQGMNDHVPDDVMDYTWLENNRVCVDKGGLKLDTKIGGVSGYEFLQNNLKEKGTLMTQEDGQKVLIIYDLGYTLANSLKIPRVLRSDDLEGYNVTQFIDKMNGNLIKFAKAPKEGEDDYERHKSYMAEFANIEHHFRTPTGVVTDLDVSAPAVPYCKVGTGLFPKALPTVQEFWDDCAKAKLYACNRGTFTTDLDGTARKEGFRTKLGRILEQLVPRKLWGSTLFVTFRTIWNKQPASGPDGVTKDIVEDWKRRLRTEQNLCEFKFNFFGKISKENADVDIFWDFGGSKANAYIKGTGISLGSFVYPQPNSPKEKINSKSNDKITLTEGVPSNMEGAAVQFDLNAQDRKFESWFREFKSKMDKIHGNYAAVCEANGLVPSDNCSYSGWQTWDTPGNMYRLYNLETLRPSQRKLKSFCSKLQRTLYEAYNGKFDFNNLPSDKESYFQSVSMINKLCEDRAAMEMFQRSFQRIKAEGELTITLCGAGSSKVHVNKYILGQSNGHGNGKPDNSIQLKLQEQRLREWEQDLSTRIRNFKRQQADRTAQPNDQGKYVNYKHRNEDGKHMDIKTFLRQENAGTLRIGSEITCAKGKGGTIFSGKRKRFTGQKGIVLNVDTELLLDKPVLVRWDSNTTKSDETVEDHTGWTNCLIEEINPYPQEARRRMAQREFSDRRDSPVMTRLLEEIVAAQDNQDD